MALYFFRKEKNKTMEIEISGKMYQLKATLKFMECVEPLKKVKTEGGEEVELGLANLITQARDTGDPRALRDLIFYLNEGQNPRMTKQTANLLIDDENTDLEALAGEIFDFLYAANVSRMRLKALGFLPEEKKETKDLKA